MPDTPASPTERLRLRVTARHPVGEGIVAFELRAPDDAPLPAFTAGAHVDVQVPDGAGQVRPYSLYNDPADRSRYCIAVQHESAGRGGSRALHAQVQVGDLLEVGRPRNQFALRPAPHVLLLAGGIGLTPLLAMAHTLWAQDHSFELHVFARHAARLPLVATLAAQPFAAAVRVHLDDGGAAPPPLQGSAEALDALLTRAPAGALAYACGPAGFMAAVQAAAAACAWAPERVVVEHFSAPVAAPTAATSAPGEGFELHWAPTGQRVPVPAELSVAQALQAAGLPVSLSCEQGICGSCELQVIDGLPEHRDLLYADAERAANDRFTPCCSRSRSACLTVAPMGWVGGAG